MHSTLILMALAALAQAGRITLPPPILIRDTVQNSTFIARLDQDFTRVDAGPKVHYKDTVAWQMYIAFLVLGILIAVLMPAAVYSPDMLYWYRSMRAKKQTEQRKVDVEVATLKMQDMLQRPEGAHLRTERYG